MRLGDKSFTTANGRGDVRRFQVPPCCPCNSFIHLLACQLGSSTSSESSFLSWVFDLGIWGNKRALGIA